MKILCISNAKISEQEGDSIHILEIALNLQKLGNNIMLICQRGKKNSHRLTIKRIPALRIKYFTSIFFDLASIPYLIFYVIKFKPDAVYYRDIATGGIMSWLLKVPSVAEANGIYSDIAKIERPRFFRIAGKFLRLREHAQFLGASRIICVTEGIKNELVKHYGVKSDVCKVIHNGVNIQLFKPFDKMACRKQIDIEEDGFYIGFVGSFKAWQGLESLIEAMKIVKEKGYDNIKCLLVGDGYLMKRLRELVRRYGLQKDIIFRGRVLYNDVPTFINSFDICYLCKIDLNFGFSPLKLFEYLACAKPIIASRADGINEIIEGGNCGYLFDPDDIKGLTLNIIKSFNGRNRLSQLGINGRRFVKDQFSWKKVASSVQSVLKEATGRVID
jgi:glycosyltransferase involved in cell wall biosynthesis